MIFLEISRNLYDSSKSSRKFLNIGISDGNLWGSFKESPRIPQTRPPQNSAELNLVNGAMALSKFGFVFSVHGGDVIWSNEASYLHQVDLNVATGILPSH